MTVTEINIRLKITYLSLGRLLVKVNPMKGRSFPENSVTFWLLRCGGGFNFSNSSKFDVSSLLITIGTNGGVTARKLG